MTGAAAVSMIDKTLARMIDETLLICRHSETSAVRNNLKSVPIRHIWFRPRLVDQAAVEAICIA
jgi:hypothetical protein